MTGVHVGVGFSFDFDVEIGFADGTGVRAAVGVGGIFLLSPLRVCLAYIDVLYGNAY